MSRLKSLKRSKPDGEKKVAPEQTQTTVKKDSQAKSENERIVEKPKTRIAGLKRVSTAQEKQVNPNPEVKEEQVARKSRLSSLNITKRDDTPRPVPMDEEVAQFQEDLDKLGTMVDQNAPELREGISSVMARMQNKEHLVEYLYENPSELAKAIRAFRAQFKKRHRETSERATKKAKTKAETADFLELAGL